MSPLPNRQRLGAIPAVGHLEPPALPRNAVLEGDCLKVMAGLPAESIDMVLTDPPYLVNYRDRHGRSIANDNDPDWVAPAFAGIARLMKPGSLCVSFYGWQAADVFMSAWRNAGLRPIGHLVFVKRYASSRKHLAAHHEAAYLLAKGRPATPPRTAHGTPAEAISDVREWSYTGNRLHPTQKPVEPLAPLVRAFSPWGGLVLDPFAGSGSSLLAAKKEGRHYLGIELDPVHVATARRQLEIGP